MRIPYPGFIRLVAMALMMNLLGGQILHESGHWAVMQAFGRQPLWGFTSLVQLWEREPADPTQWVAITAPDGDQGWLHLGSVPESDLEWVLFLAAGPLAQLLAMAIGLAVSRSASTPVMRTLGFLLAVVNAFSGFLYQLVSTLRGGGGDETLIGYYLHVPPLVISTLFGLGFAVGIVLALRSVESWTMAGKWTAAFFLGILPLGPLFGWANGQIIDQVDGGNPLFRSILGFSLPVAVSGALAFLALWLLAYQWERSSFGSSPRSFQGNA